MDDFEKLFFIAILAQTPNLEGLAYVDVLHRATTIFVRRTGTSHLIWAL